LLKSVGDTGINRKNRDEVLVALNCYGKIITSSNSKKKKVFSSQLIFFRVTWI
jgi:hypothetical protein